MANLAWQITSPGVLSLNDLGPIPSPGPHQALVEIKAVAFNYRDVLVLQHSSAYPVKAKPNLTPCSDGAGVVSGVGASSKWKAGDRVLVHPNTWKTGLDPRNFVINQTMGGGEVDGTLRKYLVIDDDRLVKAPDNLSLEEACTVYTAGNTAWHSLVHGLFKVEQGMRVLTMGTGGVSCYAIMIAAAFGAEVIATSSSDKKLEYARKLGATHLINYKKHPVWEEEVLKATEGKGVDIAVDVVGAQSIEQVVRSVRHGGLIALPGMLSDDPEKPVNIMTSLLFGAKTIQGILGAGSREMAEELSAFIERHKLHPPIAQVFNFDEADKALEAAASLSTVGKIVVRL